MNVFICFTYIYKMKAYSLNINISTMKLLFLQLRQDLKMILKLDDQIFHVISLCSEKH